MGRLRRQFEWGATAWQFKFKLRSSRQAAKIAKWMSDSREAAISFIAHPSSLISCASGAAAARLPNFNLNFNLNCRTAANFNCRLRRPYS